VHTDAEQKPGAGVETVNPNYPPPPGTPQQVKQMEAEIENLLAARAAAEQSEARMTAEEQQHRQNQEHAQHAVQSTDQAISATAAHQQVVAKRQATNQQQQQRQQESQGLVAGYPSQATGLAALTGPLTVFQGFTHLASALPGSAGDSMQKMADDSDRLMAAFGQMGSGMESQNAAQPARQQELQGDQQRLESTDQQAQASDDQLQQAKQGAETFRQTNAAKLEQATQARAEASDQKQELEEAATTKQTQAETLSQQMQEWAVGHKAARDAAIEETKQRLQTEGKIVTGTSQGT
jgi:chromosome segregation ATPase